MVGGVVVTGDDLAAALDRLELTRPQAAAMFRELFIALGWAELDRPDGAENLLTELSRRWPAYSEAHVLDEDQAAEVRAWLASR